MKFSEMPYKRPDIDEARRELGEIRDCLRGADSVEVQLDAIDRYLKLTGHFETDATLAYVRHTIDTRDEYYDAENSFFDENGPLLAELNHEIERALLNSPFRAQLEEKFGKLLFTNLEIAARCFKPEMVELMQEENRLKSEYQNLYASAMVDFDGQTMPLPKLGPYKQSTDRAVRKAAYEAEGKFFDDNREALDALYDKLVKNRTAQAKILGHDNYLRLGYDLLGRNCYGADKVAEFRGQIARDLVPIVSRMKDAQRERLGVESMKMWDDTLLFPDGNPVPHGTADDILAAGLEMYRGLSSETAEFINHMYENELLDVLSREGKAPGGYCTTIFDYRSPFIFSNFNGTAGDVDVLTHEAGHAFAGYRAMKNGIILPLLSPTMEACECHSMSMEFLTAPYHHLFFKEDTRKYEIAHCEESLTFIPYGCMVDEFQHRMYENPDLTPEGRNAVWFELEKKYRPWIDFGDLPFYGRGAGWQRQLHIYLYPFYYIDYCMAQTVAFQFWMASLENREDAWRRYLDFADKGGKYTFEELVHGAGLKLPYDTGCIASVGGAVERWLKENSLK
ncbi:MAG: M3 family oligoendopeptidase [Oscillospiraceae bacterium]|nr:M3 family oligoendopeptidase [Oscillospiraceae bacterium]